MAGGRYGSVFRHTRTPLDWGMARMDDLELGRSPVEQFPEGPAPGAPRWPLALAAGVVAVAAVVAFFVRRHREPAAGTAAPESPPSVAERAPARDEPIVLPPLSESDPVVRELVRRLSSHPIVLSWLTTDGLLENAAVT